MKENFCDRDTAKKFYVANLFSGKDSVINEITKREIESTEQVKDFYNKMDTTEYNRLGKTFAFLYHKWEFKTIIKIMEFFENKGVCCYADLHDGFLHKKRKPIQI